MSTQPIDFVVTWVDDNDPAWRTERSRFLPEDNADASDRRYREWDTMRYWFRSIEKFALWVNKIHFVTWGHIPAWLDTENPKLHIVRHEDFLPEEYRPTFSSDTLVLNVFRIPGLSENFTLFDDDVFLLQKTTPEDFFVDGKPRATALLNVHCYEMRDMKTLLVFRNIGIINKYFNMREVLKKNRKKWYNPAYGLQVLRNFYLLPCPRFPGMMMMHVSSNLCKSTCEEVWAKEGALLDEVSRQKFRGLAGFNQWLYDEWQMASGNFEPRPVRFGASLNAYDMDGVCDFIRKQKRKVLCFNDVDMTEDEFQSAKKQIHEAFQSVLPEKSSFEKY